MAVLGCMIEDTALVPKLIQRGLTKPIVKVSVEIMLVNCRAHCLSSCNGIEQA